MNIVLTHNKDLDSDFKEIDCTSENNNLLKKMLVLTKLLIIGSLDVEETEHMQRLCQV